ncbi:hypothetical protein [Streptacidiphilus fuscans]|uniref:Uncharacterized protein n=1 Tax=Streptacidiphilus fuscans TaxID=2789292 RepID=A0A931BB08_9ACTN|nr:hypothetical protein [Streptacidiphilus fuscans]MBF9070125.1 hypothetical protein [Streptacidiphilus fuscans]
MLTHRRPTMLLLCGLTAATLAGTAGCSSSTKAAVSSAASGKASSLASAAQSAAAGAAASVKASVSAKASAKASSLVVKNVTAGAFCAMNGENGETKSGQAMTCKKDSAGKDRWTSAVNASASAKAGQFCATSNATATSGSTKLVCKAGSDGRDRWTKQ